MTENQRIEAHEDSLRAEIASCLPIIKVESGKYLIGTEVRTIALRANEVVVRNAKGNIRLEEWLQAYARSELKKINSVLKK